MEPGWNVNAQVRCKATENQWNLINLRRLLQPAEDLETLRALEKERDVEPDWNVNAYMRCEATENKRRSVLTDFVVRMLGLGICSDTEVRAHRTKF